MFHTLVIGYLNIMCAPGIKWLKIHIKDRNKNQQYGSADIMFMFRSVSKDFVLVEVLLFGISCLILKISMPKS